MIGATVVGLCAAEALVSIGGPVATVVFAVIGQVVDL